MTAPVVEGQVLDGKYVVEKVLGCGGMGVVVRAYHRILDDRVAIKFLLPEATLVPEAVARFTREARAATKIKGEHVVRVIDVGQFQTGEPYIVMEYLQGRDLGQVVRERGPMPVAEAVDYVLQGCEALAEAHALGIVHRDLKPANLFVTKHPDGSALVKVLDFGISKLTNAAGSGPDLGLTKTSAMMGSPLYMSPEQMASARDVDAGTDIWAIGAVLYELLSGRPPFDAETLPQLCAMVLQSRAAPLDEVRPEVPAEVARIVDRCLEKDRAKRFRDVGELARALRDFAPRRARVSVERISRILEPAGPDAGATALPQSLPESISPSDAAPRVATAVSWGETAPSVPKGSRAPLALAAAIALVIVGGVALLLRGALGGGDAPAATSAVESAVAAPPPPAPSIAEPAAPSPMPSTEPTAAPSASSTPKLAAKTGKPSPAPATASAKPAPAELPAAPPPPAAPASKPPPPAPPPAHTNPSIGGRL